MDDEIKQEQESFDDVSVEGDIDPGQEDAGQEEDTSLLDIAAEKPEKPEDKDTSVQYWQSQYDKEREATRQMEQQLAAIDPYMPILQQIQQNPQALQTLLGQTIQQQQEDVRPEKPQKPVNYDPAEAIMEPESESYRYQIAREEYNEKMADWRDRQAETREQTFQQVEKQRQMDEGMRLLKYQLGLQYGYSPQEQEEFAKDMVDPKNFDLDTMAEYFRFRKQKLAGKKQLQPARQFSAPAAKLPGGSTQRAPSADNQTGNAFEGGLIKAYREMNKGG